MASADVRQLIESKQVASGSLVREEEEENWTPVEQSPFGSLVLQSAPGGLSLFAHVGLLVIAALLFFLMVKRCESAMS